MSSLTKKQEDTRGATMIAFNQAFAEYKRISGSWTALALGRGNMYNEAMRFSGAMESRDNNSTMEQDAADCFIMLGFNLDVIKGAEELDMHFRNIYNNNLAFRRQWVRCIDKIILYVQALYTENDWNKSLLTGHFSWSDWLDIVAKFQSIKKNVDAQSKIYGRAVQRQKKNKKLLEFKNSELPDAHALDRMRGLLDELTSPLLPLSTCYASPHS